MSQHEDLSRLPADACENLLTKTRFMALDDRRLTREYAGQVPDTAVYWCALTQMSWGPDDDHACADSCRPGRSCHTSRPHLQA